MPSMIDFLASERHFVDHLVPVWRALPREARANFLVGSSVAYEHAVACGVRPVMLNSRLPDRPILTASIGDYNRARRMRRRRLAYIEHGVGQSYAGDRRTANHPSYAGGGGRDACSLIMAPNEIAAARWREAYPAAEVEVIGATRVLPPPESSDPLLCLSFHWAGPIPEQHNAFAVYRPILGELAKRMPIIGHAHPRMAGAVAPRFRRVGIPFIHDLDQVARVATVYAVDNSSTLYELGRTRPVIALNAPEYRRDVHHGLRFWSHIPGPQADTPEQFIAIAERLLAGGETEEERERREAVLADVIPHLDGAERASRLLMTWRSGSG